MSKADSLDHVPEGTASTKKALFMLLKSFIGTGVVFLPGSFASGGLVLSIVLMLSIGLICLYSFQLLVAAQMKVGGDYDVVAKALYGRWLQYVILFFLCVSQMGFASSYLIFISENLGLFFDQATNCRSASFSSANFIWLVLIIIIPITWVRKIAKLSWNVIIADVLILFGLVCVIYFTSSQIASQGVAPSVKMVNPTDFALTIGTSVFSFEGIGLVVPIIQGMREPEKFPRVMTVGMIISTLIFTLIGTLGYVAYGDDTHASVVANLPAHLPLSEAIQLCYALAITLSSPFVLYPALSIVEHILFNENQRGRIHWKYKWMKNLVRSLIPIVCATISYLIGSDGLNKFVALVGSLCCMPLAFIFPGLFHYKISKSTRQKAMGVIVTLWGFAVMIFTLIINIRSWIDPTFLSVRAPTPSVCPIQGTALTQ
ncbi:transmembrane amino acid transporter protein-domain-containing protein [Gongronella butleri]|nr:transmembrane amino acid transporter protein-domain-containing protein [Gongronella butleri]